MKSASSFDARDFRQALSMFATGVTIVTARGDDGEPVGLTVNSFNSVSLTPPMVLWSIAKSARSRPVFSGDAHWNVHILAEEQEALSNRFSRAGEDKFFGLTLERGVSDAPLLPGCSARFQCQTAFEYDGGDHTIFVGKVIAYDRSNRAPLLYLSGAYALASRRAADVATQPSAMPSAPYSENLLGYLLGRAHYQFMAGFRQRLQHYALSDADFFILSLLVVREPMGDDELATHIGYTGAAADPRSLLSMVDRGLLLQADGYRLSPAGRDAILDVLASAKSAEAQLVQQLGEQDAASLRNLLKKCILASDPGLPALWTTP